MIERNRVEEIKSPTWKVHKYREGEKEAEGNRKPHELANIIRVGKTDS
jgi:hypothetical protein